MKRYAVVLFFSFIIAGSALGQSNSIADKTQNMQKYEGYFNFYWDDDAGKIWIEIDKFDQEFLYVTSLPAGLGSNDIGLDRGRLGSTKVVKFHKVGPKVLLIQPNYSYRALSDNANERKAVDEAFARSTIWGFNAGAEENGRVLVDVTNFLMRDATGVIGTLRGRNQGSYRVDASRSAMYLPKTKNFPKNTEFEVSITFSGQPTGGFVRSVTPDASVITLRQHHSLVELPDNNYKTRAFDPRSGVFGRSYMDYATPISEPIVKRFSNRHRLEKRNPNARSSEAVEPIIYYVDNGAPEPIRSALIDGALWWNQAFEAIGYKNAFQVKVLPDDADPMDVRYNVINWVHRSTRGWSYGSSVSDPRTGEIIKGHVSLGSLRVRQDFLIAEGLLSPYKDGRTVPPEMQEMALARIRQLSAHEVGHTLGFSHNFAASTNNRASVMDYPHPLVTLKANGQIDLSKAYDTDIGEWDKVAVAYAYSHFADGKNEQEELNKILEAAHASGLRFITDTDARPQGGANPIAHLWDNESNPIKELESVLKVRAKALENFSENNIRNKMPMATLEEVLVPVYLFHRYQIEGVAKILGGQDYTYKLRGDNQTESKIVPAQDQRNALQAMLKSLKPEVLTLDERIINLIPPRTPGYGNSPELFRSRTGVTFDPLTAAESAADHTISLILNAQKASRLVEFNARNPEYPGLEEVIDQVAMATIKGEIGNGLDGEVQKVVNNVFLQHLTRLAANRNTSYQARAIAMFKVEELKGWLNNKIKAYAHQFNKAHYFLAKSEIEQFQKNPDDLKYTRPLPIPNGSPIGMFQQFECPITEANWDK